jgi:hypothetical protein
MATSKTPGVTGPYKKKWGKGHRYEIRVVTPDGKQKSHWRKEKAAAEALVRQLEVTLSGKPTTAVEGDLDWYGLLKEVALAAKDAGDYTAAVSAARAAVIYKPPPPKEVEPDLSHKDKQELFDDFIAALEADGYEVRRKQGE